MKRLLITLILFLAAVQSIYGQAPARINYQAVAHNLSSGDVYANRQLSIRFSIIPGSPGNPPTYQEEHTGISTNEFGLFNIQIGGGSVISGSFSAIVWSASNHFLRVEVDDGSGYQILGTSQFLSVPYALYAQNSGSSGFTAGAGIDISGGVISNTGDPDDDPTNEIQDLSYNAITRDLSISAGSTINLSSLIDDADPSPTNEIQTLTYNTGTNILSLSSSGTVDLSGLIDDADASTTNETVSGFGVSGSNLELVESGTTFQIPLSQLSDNDWQTGTGTVYNTSGNIGIGINAPADKLHVNGGTIRIQNGGSYYRLPGTDGASGEVMVTNGAGNLAWADPNTLITANPSHIFDSDGNTLVHTEQSTNEDYIRFITAGTQRMSISNTGMVRIDGTVQIPAGSGAGKVLTSNGSGIGSWDYALSPIKITTSGSGHTIVAGTTTYLSSPILTFTPEASGVVKILYTCRYNRSTDYPHQCSIGFHVKTTSGVPVANTAYTAFTYTGQAQPGSGGFGDEQVAVSHAMAVTAGLTYYVYVGANGANYNTLCGGILNSHKTIVTLHKSTGL